MKKGLLFVGLIFIVVGVILFTTLPPQFFTSGSCVSWNNFVCLRYSTTTTPNPSYSTMMTLSYATLILGVASIVFGLFIPRKKKQR